MLNNDGYLAIRTTQDAYFGGHYVASDPSSGVTLPDYVKIAEAYGLSTDRIATHDRMETTIQSVLAHPGPVLCEVKMSPVQTLYPKLASEIRPDGTMVQNPLRICTPFLFTNLWKTCSSNPGIPLKSKWREESRVVDDRSRRILSKKVSVIVPAYNEQESIEVLAERLSEVFAANHRYEFEVILIENGSTDRTYEKMLRIHEKDPRFKILRLSRNFRMDGGITAGLSHASGDAAVIMTAALKDPPELIKEFLSKWEEGYENVYGIVTKRPGTGLARRFNSQVFYWLINTLTGGVMPKNVSDFRLGRQEGLSDH